MVTPPPTMCRWNFHTFQTSQVNHQKASEGLLEDNGSGPARGLGQPDVRGCQRLSVAWVAQNGEFGVSSAVSGW